LRAATYLHNPHVAMGRSREILSLRTSSFRATAQNASRFRVFVLSLRMGQGQFNDAKRQRRESPHAASSAAASSIIQRAPIGVTRRSGATSSGQHDLSPPFAILAAKLKHATLAVTLPSEVRAHLAPYYSEVGRPRLIRS
jgi:hypothetical protein